MKLCKAWPDTPGCQAGTNLTGTNSKGTNVTGDLTGIVAQEKSIVLTKSHVDRAVDRVVSSTMSDLLKDAFGEDHEDPIQIEQPEEVKKHEKTQIVTSKSDMTIIWAVLAAFGLIIILSLQNMWARIDAMEAWLHGRLATRP